MSTTSSNSLPSPVAAIWQIRERVEFEAADQFQRLAGDIAALYGESDEIAKLAARAADDELRHARRCREILRFAASGATPHEPALDVALGPPELSLRQRVLYASVALSCVTETLSVALLIEMRRTALPNVIRPIVHEILEDEISHSRLGWAELARAARREDISWLGHYVPSMIRAAFDGDVRPLIVSDPVANDFSAWGILAPNKIRAIVNDTITEVVLPGLTQSGLKM